MGLFPLKVHLKTLTIMKQLILLKNTSLYTQHSHEQQFLFPNFTKLFFLLKNNKHACKTFCKFQTLEIAFTTLWSPLFYFQPENEKVSSPILKNHVANESVICRLPVSVKTDHVPPRFHTLTQQRSSPLFPRIIAYSTNSPRPLRTCSGQVPIKKRLLWAAR